MPGRISLATFLHLKTNEPPEDRALSLTAILADAINLGPQVVVIGTRSGENGRGLSGNKPRQACLVLAWHIRDETYSKTLAELVNFAHRIPFAAHRGEGTTFSSDGHRNRAGGRRGRGPNKRALWE
jgi:hypothetical protein